MAIDFQAIRARYPLAEIVGRHVALKRAGRLASGCCPFHPDKTPSFVVYPDDTFHCFGCGAHGDVIDYVARIERLDLSEAIAKLTGGKAVELSDEDRRALERERKAAELRRRTYQENAIQDARARWAKATPINGKLPGYLQRKNVAAYGCRCEGENLLVPIMDEHGLIQSVQSIPPEEGGRKLFQPGAPVSGGRYVLGQRDDGPILIAEGFATGATLQAATGYMVAVAFSKTNMGAVARSIAARHPGRKIVICPDADGAESELDKNGRVRTEGARDIAAAIGATVVEPRLEGAEGSDFNDMAAAHGVEAVADLFKGEPAEGSIKFVDAFDFDERQIPQRPWIIPGVLLSKHTHMLAAPGGSGKSLFTLQLAIMLATGMRWGEWKPRKRCRVLVVNVEDDIDEQRRRLAASRRLMGVDKADVIGRIILADEPNSIVVAARDERARSIITTPIARELADAIRRQQFDVLIVDPFAETFGGDENDNSEVKWAMKVWRDEVARATGAAVYLVHHTNKYSAGMAGSPDAIRGAGAIVNSTRISSTLFPMTKEEAEALEIPAEDRHRYVRFDDAKANQSLISGRARWFEKVSVVLENGTAETPDGDEVGALQPWQPPNAFSGLSVATIRLALEMIDRGIEDSDGHATGERFTVHYRANSNRWVGVPVTQILGVTADRAKAIVKAWLDSGLLYETTYRDVAEGKDRKGVAVDKTKLPTLSGEAL